MSSLDQISLSSEREEPLVIPWPAPQIGVALLSFSTPDEWRKFVSSFDLHAGIPPIVSTKYRRAQKLYYVAWADFDITKAGEFVGENLGKAIAGNLDQSVAAVPVVSTIPLVLPKFG